MPSSILKKNQAYGFWGNFDELTLGVQVLMPLISEIQFPISGLPMRIPI
jgi:hypothetical protein